MYVHQQYNHAALDLLPTLTANARAGLRVSPAQIRRVRPLWHCPTCTKALAKAPSHPSRHGRRISERPFEVLHADVVDLPRITGMGHGYALIAVDDWSRYTFAVPLKTKGQATAELKKLITREQRIGKDRLLRTLKTDNAPELTSALRPFLESEGITTETTIPGQSQSNGVAERAIQAITTRARQLIIASGLPTSNWWQDALLAGCWTHNLMPPTSSRQGTQSRAELYKGSPPPLPMHAFGSLAYLHLAQDQRDHKLSPRAVEAMLVGYDAGRGTKGWRWAVYDPSLGTFRSQWAKPYQWTRRQYHEVFPDRFPPDVSRFPAQSLPDRTLTDTEIKDGKEKRNEVEIANPNAPPRINTDGDATIARQTDTQPTTPATRRYPARTHQRRFDLDWAQLPVADDPHDGDFHAHAAALPPVPLPDGSRTPAIGLCFPLPDTALPAYNDGLQPPEYKAMIALSEPGPHERIQLTKDGVPVAPKTMKGLQSHPSFEPVLEAMRTEIDTLARYGTFEVVTPPPDAQLLIGLWRINTKTDADGNFLRYRARLVAGGHQQDADTWGQTFAPAVRTPAILSLIALAGKFGLHLFTADVHSAYLNAPLTEKVYLRPPPFFPEEKGKVWRLRKSLYGLHQSGANWAVYIRDLLRGDMGFVQSLAEPCLFIRPRKGDTVLLAVHTDDLLIACTSHARYDSFLAEINTHIEVRGNGPLHYHLGCQYDTINGKLYLSQPKFIEESIAKHEVPPPLVVSLPHPSKMIPARIDPEPPALPAERRDYQAKVGSGLWAARMCRPDALFGISALSRATADPSKAHRAAATNFLRYLYGTKGYGLRLTPEPDDPALALYTDADLAGDPDQWRSTSGCLLFVYGVPVSWRSVRQPKSVTNTAAAEYTAGYEGLIDANYVKNILVELGAITSDEPIHWYCDNMAALALAEKVGSTGKLRELNIRYHNVRQHVDSGEVQLAHIAGNENPADILTKPATKVSLLANLPRLKLENVTTFHRATETSGQRGC